MAVKKQITKIVSINFQYRHWQADVDSQIKHRTVLNIHRGGGKTYFGCKRLAEAIGTTTTSDGSPARFAYIGKSQSHAKQTVWKIFKFMFRELDKAGLVKFNENDLTITNTTNGNEIILSGIDSVDKNRGLHLHGFVLDEAQECDDASWNEVLFPTISQKNGWILVIGTPKGPKGIFYELWDIGNDPQQKAWTSITKTIEDTGEYDEEVMAAARLTSTKEQIQQEYYCSFMAAVDNRVYPNFDVRKGIPEEEAKLGVVPHIRPFVLTEDMELSAIEVGADFNIAFMVWLIGVKTSYGLHIIAELIGQDITTDVMAMRLVNEFPSSKITVYPDASGGNRSTTTNNTNHSLLRDAGLKLVVNAKNPPVYDRINCVNVLLQNAAGQRRLFVDPKCVNTIKTLSFHQKDEYSGDPNKKSGLDHAGDALGYMVWHTFPVKKSFTSKVMSLRF